MNIARTPKLLIVGGCLLGMVACGLMWSEAGLPPKDRPLELFGRPSSERRFVTQQPHPESNIAFGGGIFAIVLLSTLGLIKDRDETRHDTSSLSAGIGCTLVGVFLLLMLHTARRVNGVDLAVLQPGHLLGLLAGMAITIAGLMVLAKPRDRAG